MDKSETFRLSESIGFAVNRTALRLANGLARALTPFDVTPQQWAVLNRLWEEDGLSQFWLAERTFRDQPGTARILDRLEQKGLVRRERDQTDRRIHLIYLTDSGNEMQQRLVPEARSVLSQALEGISKHEQATVLSVLERIDRNLD